MTRILLTEGFLDSLASLDRADARRATTFLGKLVNQPTAAGIRPRILHDAADRNVRALSVTHDLRAIVRIIDDDLVMLHVDRHDRAYVWAKTHCFECDDGGTYRVTVSDAAADTSATSDGQLHVCATSRDLCLLLDKRGIAHELAG